MSNIIYDKSKYTGVFSAFVKTEPDTLKIYNEMEQQDIDAIMVLHHSNSLVTLPKLGGGENGTVFLFKGVQGKEYAIKSIAYRRYDSKDVFFAEKIMGGKHLPVMYMSYGRSLLVMEKVNGSTIAELAIRIDKIEHIADNFMEVLREQVEHCYSVGVVPSDLTFDNIMVNEHGLPVIIDFGHFREEDDPRCRKDGSIHWVNKNLDAVQDFINNVRYCKRIVA